MPAGKVKWFNNVKGYGFIEPEGGGKDVLVHSTAVQAAGLASLQENQRVEFEMSQGRDGRASAENLKALD
jgi:CspA family cold shock protein